MKQRKRRGRLARRRARATILPLIAMAALASAALLLVLVTAYYATGERWEGLSGAWQPHSVSMRAVRATSGNVVSAKPSAGAARELRLQPSRLTGAVEVRADLPPLVAAQFARLDWPVSNLRDGDEVSVEWEYRWESRELSATAPARVRDGTASLVFSDVTQWRGKVTRLGLRVRPASSEAVSVRAPVLHRERPPIGAIMRSFVDGWTATGPWMSWSINSLAPVTLTTPPLNLLVGVWAWLATILYLALLRRSGQRVSSHGILVFFVLGWLLMDLRWQADLSAKIRHDRARYAGLTLLEKRAKGVFPPRDRDGAYFSAASEIRSIIGDRASRLLIIAPSGRIDGTAGVPQRLTYYLRPFDVMWTIDPVFIPTAISALRRDDYILYLPRLLQLELGADQSDLLWDGHPVGSVKLVARLKIGLLLQVDS